MELYCTAHPPLFEYVTYIPYNAIYLLLYLLILENLVECSSPLLTQFGSGEPSTTNDHATRDKLLELLRIECCAQTKIAIGRGLKFVLLL